MSHAFGISEEDVVTVVQQRFGRKIAFNSAQLTELFDSLDGDRIADCALHSGVEMDEQIEGAYDEIERQLRADSDAMSLIAALPSFTVSERA